MRGCVLRIGGCGGHARVVIGQRVADRDGAAKPPLQYAYEDDDISRASLLQTVTKEEAHSDLLAAAARLHRTREGANRLPA